MEFYGLEPWGSPVDDLRHGLQCATFLAPYATRGNAPDPRDFMVRQPPEREPTPEETASLLDAIFKTGPAPVRDDEEEEG